jgi:glycogen operon protein
MLLAGDELGNSQGGNNNAYCQDNPTGWLDWKAGEANGDFTAFTRHLIALRRRFPALRRVRFLTGSLARDSALKDVMWLVPDGSEKTEQDWNYPDARSLCFLLAGDTAKRGDAEDPLLVVLNAHVEAMVYRIPPIQGIVTWECVLDTASPAGHDGQEPLPSGAKIEVAPRTVVVMCGRRGTETASP